MNKKQQSASAPALNCKAVKINVYAPGSTGHIETDALCQNIMAVSKAEGFPSIDLDITLIDLDIGSDSKAATKRFANAIEPICQELASRQDTSGILGTLRSIRADELNLSQEEHQKTTEEFVVEQVPPGEQDSARTALKVFAPAGTRQSIMGNGGLGCPLAGHFAAVTHRDKLRELILRNEEAARNDPSRHHVHLILNSFCGSSGYNLSPEMMRIFCELQSHQKVYAVFDGGLFLAHSSAYSDPKYLGTRNVGEKSVNAMNVLHSRRLLDCLEAAVFMTPINPSATPYNLCPVSRLKGEQQRHSCLEYLLGTRAILEIICQVNQRSERYHYLSGSRVLVLQRDPDAPSRALSWNDLELSEDSYMRLIRMFAVGAATRSLIWSQDDTLIANIPAIASLLEKNIPLSQIKATGGAIADACVHQLQQFYDYAATGTNFELQNTDGFVVANAYRLMNLPAVKEILDGSLDLHFVPSTIGDYKQSIGTAAPFQEKQIKSSSLFSRSVKNLIDRTRSASSVEDFYIRLFQTQ